MKDHTAEHVLRPRRARAAHAKASTQALVASGQVGPAAIVDVPEAIRWAPQWPVRHRIEPVDTHRAALAAPGRVGALVFGSATRAGGGWENGAKAQEEDVSLASTWATQAALAPGFYASPAPMGPDKVLIAPGYWLRGAKGEVLSPPRPVVFAGIAAPNRANQQLEDVAPQVLIDALARRLFVAMAQWKGMGVDTLVLGAIGCGVFAWPPEQSAQALRCALSQARWPSEVVLAMPDPTLGQVFSEVLSRPGTVSMGASGP